MEILLKDWISYFSNTVQYVDKMLGHNLRFLIQKKVERGKKLHLSVKNEYKTHLKCMRKMEKIRLFFFIIRQSNKVLTVAVPL